MSQHRLKMKTGNCNRQCSYSLVDGICYKAVEWNPYPIIARIIIQ